jgi:hypothetical protein
MRWVEILSQAVGGNLSFGDSMANTDEDLNLNVWKASGVSPGVADTDFTVAHSLRRVPITIVGQDTDNGGLLYRGSAAWTTAAVTLKCTKATSAYNVILA